MVEKDNQENKNTVTLHFNAGSLCAVRGLDAILEEFVFDTC